MREADAGVHRPQQEGAERGGAALTDERDVAGEPAQRARRCRRPDVVPDVGEAQAVGAGNAQAGLFGISADLLLQLKAFGDAAFGKPRRNHQRGTGFFRVTFLHHRQHFVVRHDDAHEVRRFGKIGDAAVALDVGDLVVIRIHRVDAHAVFAFQHGVQEPPAVAALGGCADHRDRLRIEHFVDRPHLVIRPEFHGSAFHLVSVRIILELILKIL